MLTAHEMEIVLGGGGGVTGQRKRSVCGGGGDGGGTEDLLQPSHNKVLPRLLQTRGHRENNTFPHQTLYVLISTAHFQDFIVKIIHLP